MIPTPPGGAFIRSGNSCRPVRRSSGRWWKCGGKLKPGGKADPEFYISRGASMLLGFAAAAGLPDLGEACSEFIGAIRERWNEKDFFEAYTVKSVEEGVQDVPEEEGGGDVPF